MATDQTANTALMPESAQPDNPGHVEPHLYDDEEPLFHVSLNPSQPETIVFLHGLWSAHLEWAFVTPYLSDYHLVLVDLPGHGKSSHLFDKDPKNITIPVMADRVASLIRRVAHGGKAHVVGLSMGGFITMTLVNRYPSLFQGKSAFVTGAAPFEGVIAFMARQSWIIYAVMWTFAKMPDTLFWWISERGTAGLRRFEELRAEMKAGLKWGVISGVYASILEEVSGEKGWEIVRGLARGDVRMVNVSGGRMDDLRSSGGIKKIWEEEGVLGAEGSTTGRNRVVVVKDAVHAWDLQLPELFARGVEAWIKGEALPQEFEDL
ncbi:Dihydrolipoyllysine-residue acetyltransferase component of acetoin cleaving system [Naviculisporaceae sp. PSN 640]